MRKKNCFVEEDIRMLLRSGIPVEKLKNNTLMITGITGLIGSLIAKFFIEYNKTSVEKIKIVGIARSRKKYESIFGENINNDNLNIIYHDITEPIEYLGNIDYIIHGASITSSLDFVKKPVETIHTAIKGTTNMLELAREKNVKGFIYLSSLEVYGMVEGRDTIRECDYGYLEPLSPRSSYSESKRMVECLCISYSVEYNVNVSIARLAQTFGAGVDYHDTRVFAQFARCVIEERDIILHTRGETVRNYCYTMDAVSAVIYMLLYGKTREVYNVANKDTVISIYEMAQRMSHLSNSSIEVKIEEGNTETNHGYNPTMRAVLNVEKLDQLNWKPLFSMEEMLIRLVESMKVH